MGAVNETASATPRSLPRVYCDRFSNVIYITIDGHFRLRAQPGSLAEREKGRPADMEAIIMMISGLYLARQMIRQLDQSDRASAFDSRLGHNVRP